MSTTMDDIKHYQRKIEKYASDSKVLLHCLNKLTKLPIGVEHLQVTGIGRTVNSMRKMEGVVGDTARALVNRWKEMVAAEDEKSESDAHEDDEVEDDIHQNNDSNSSSDDATHVQIKSKQLSESSAEQYPSTSNRKSSKSSSEKSKKVDKKKESNGESSRSKSKSSRKRRHSQDDSSSQADEDAEGDGGAASQSFADVLGSIETVPKKKKSKDKDRHKEKKKSSSSVAAEAPAPLSVPPPPNPLVAKPIDIRPADFEISPHYKPLPLKYESMSKEKTRTVEQALSLAMAQKGLRTKVFSGNRSSGLQYVPSLYDCCVRTLQQKPDAADYNTKTFVPFHVLRPVLERCTAVQLFNWENCYCHLLDDTDELWKILCQKEYKKAVREEMETWRELYLRCQEEREERFKSLTNSHKLSLAKAAPVRTTKLTYVDTITKAPRGKSGQSKQCSSAVLASMTNAKTGARPFEASTNHASNGTVTVAEAVKLPPPSSSRSSSSSSAPAAKKPKVAPLMQKTLKLMKNRFRR